MSKSLKMMLVAGAVAVFAFGASDAQAQYSCSDATYGSGGSYSEDSDCSSGNTANQSSAVATSQAVLKTAASQASKIISGRIASASGNGFDVASNGFSASTGLAGGSLKGKTQAWISGSWTSVEDNNTATAFEGDSFDVFVGADYKVNKKTLVGVALGYGNIDIDTEYNGTATQDGSLESDGYTVAPYVSYKLSEKATGKFIVGYTYAEYDTVRFDPNTGNRISGDTDANRYFVSAGVSGEILTRGKFTLLGDGTIFYATEEKDSYTETEAGGATISQGEDSTHLAQAIFDARLGYDLGGKVTPYALVGVEYDIAKSDSSVAAGQTQSMDEDFGARFGGGVNLNLGPNVVGGLEVYTVEFRDDYDEVTGTANLKVKF